MAVIRSAIIYAHEDQLRHSWKNWTMGHVHAGAIVLANHNPLSRHVTVIRISLIT